MQHSGIVLTKSIARRVLFGRHVKNLEQIAEVVDRRAPGSVKRRLLPPVWSAIAALPTMPEMVPSFIEPTNSCAELASEYLTLLLVLKREDAFSLISRHLKFRLKITDLVEYVVKPVQQEVGRLWQENRITAIQELPHSSKRYPPLRTSTSNPWHSAQRDCACRLRRRWAALLGLKNLRRLAPGRWLESWLCWIELSNLGGPKADQK